MGCAESTRIKGVVQFAENSERARAMIDVEADVEKSFDRIRAKIRENQDMIADLKAQGVTSDTIPLIIARYEQNARLVQKYDIEPDALLEYVSFLADMDFQYMCNKAKELCEWLTYYYALKGANKWQSTMFHSVMASIYSKEIKVEAGKEKELEDLAKVRMSLFENAGKPN